MILDLFNTYKKLFIGTKSEDIMNTKNNNLIRTGGKIARRGRKIISRKRKGFHPEREAGKPVSLQLLR